jgi:general stress protein YciG
MNSNDSGPRRPRGFAAMDPERQRAIASMGGKAVPGGKRSFSQNKTLASQAGRKGGLSVPDERRSFSQNRSLAAAAGRKGGQSVPHEKRSFSQNHALAAEAGRKGGLASHTSDA